MEYRPKTVRPLNSAGVALDPLIATYPTTWAGNAVDYNGRRPRRAILILDRTLFSGDAGAVSLENELNRFINDLKLDDWKS